jgi:predicted Zn finger-like uncharacterized protein
MYTQCPECKIAFKVTADVLKRAAGKVRCGSCGNAFDSLAYLSEKMPSQPAVRSGGTVAEITPGIIAENDGVPQAISAEQSAALLKTLDQLAGSDIRIEDTGVEWRVLDDEEAAAPAADDDDAGAVDNIDVTNLDEFLDDAQTPIDEFLTATPEVVDAPEIFEEAARESSISIVSELRFDDNTPLPDDFDLDSQSPNDAKSVTDALTASDELADEALLENVHSEIALSNPDEWQDILGEFQELAVEVTAPTEVQVGENEYSADSEVALESGTDEMLDMDTQFALQAEAMGIDLSGINELDVDDDAADIELLDDELVDDEPADEPESDYEAPEGSEKEPEPEEEIEQLKLIGEQDELTQEPIVENHAIEDELATDDPDAESYDNSHDQQIPPMTEEEHTVNMQIDEELMALAVQDRDGFASTIVFAEGDIEIGPPEENGSSAEDDVVEDSGSPNSASLFETIVMEGEGVRTIMDSQKLAANASAASGLAGAARAEAAEQAALFGGRSLRMVGAIAALSFFLVIQVIHQSREALATLPAFGNTVGQFYRAIGQPVQPAWDITGWRFEATNGSAEDNEDALTIYSRLGNDSDSALPYPLIGISLTDRFEETIGSRILNPGEYLLPDLDPRKLVEPGDTFNAVMTIKSVTGDATGFKLNVCYRLADGLLRCAIDDFK